MIFFPLQYFFFSLFLHFFFNDSPLIFYNEKNNKIQQPAYIVAIFSCFVVYLVLIPSKMTTGKEEREREKNCSLVALFPWHKRSQHLICPITFLTSSSSWDTMKTKFCSLGTPSWPLCCIWKLEVPCSMVPVLVFKDGGLTFKKEGDEKKGSAGVGELWRPTGGGQRPSTYNNFKWANFENKTFHCLSQLLKTYDIHYIYYIKQHNIFAPQKFGPSSMYQGIRKPDLRLRMCHCLADINFPVHSSCLYLLHASDDSWG